MDSDLIGLGGALRLCTSNKLPAHTKAAVLWTILSGPRSYSLVGPVLTSRGGVEGMRGQEIITFRGFVLAIKLYFYILH